MVTAPQEDGHTTRKGQDTAVSEGTVPGDDGSGRANGEDGQEEITNARACRRSPGNGDRPLAPGHACATCGQKFKSKNRLHRHLRDDKHQLIDEHDHPGVCESSDDEEANARGTEVLIGCFRAKSIGRVAAWCTMAVGVLAVRHAMGYDTLWVHHTAGGARGKHRSWSGMLGAAQTIAMYSITSMMSHVY